MNSTGILTGYATNATATAAQCVTQYGNPDVTGIGVCLPELGDEAEADV